MYFWWQQTLGAYSVAGGGDAERFHPSSSAGKLRAKLRLHRTFPLAEFWIRDFELLLPCAFSLPFLLVTSCIANSIPVNMSPSNTPACMAATSQDIEMLLAAQVRAIAPHSNSLD
jgi:hypothetical protein